MTYLTSLWKPGPRRLIMRLLRNIRIPQMLPEWYRAGDSFPYARAPLSESRAVQLVFCKTFFCFNSLVLGTGMSVFFKSICHSGLLACAGLAGLVLAAPAAFAQAPPPTTTSFQNCTTTQVATPFTITNIGTLAIPTSATAAAISAAIGSVNTAFLTRKAAPSCRRRPIPRLTNLAAAYGLAASAAK